MPAMTVCGGDVGLTFCGVHEQAVDLLLGIELDMHRQTRAAHADRTGTVNGIEKFCAVLIVRNGERRTGGLLAVRCDLDRLAGCALGRTVFRDRCDRTGNACVDVGRKLRIARADALPDRHVLAQLDDRLADRTDMHLHGDEHLFRDGQDLEWRMCRGFGVRQPDTVELSHGISPL